MKIKDGFNGKETIIRIGGQSNGTIELWIHETGVEGGKERLSYMTADELLELHKEIKSAVRDIFDL